MPYEQVSLMWQNIISKTDDINKKASEYSYSLAFYLLFREY